MLKSIVNEIVNLGIWVGVEKPRFFIIDNKELPVVLLSAKPSVKRIHRKKQQATVTYSKTMQQ